MTHDAFVAAIAGEPDDPLHCRAYADWLTEQGADELAFALRWMARHGRRPHRRERYRSGAAVSGHYSWGWYRMAVRGGRGGKFNPDPPGQAWLPRTVFAAITGGDHAYYSEWDIAVLALSLALATMRRDLET